MDEGKTPYQVREYFIKHIRSEKFEYDLKYRVALFLQEFTGAGTLSQQDIDNFETTNDLVGIVFKNEVYDSKTIDAFWFTQNAFNTTNKYSRLFCLICFAIGSLLFSVVLLQNFKYVLETIL